MSGLVDVSEFRFECCLLTAERLLESYFFDQSQIKLENTLEIHIKTLVEVIHM